NRKAVCEDSHQELKHPARRAENCLLRRESWRSSGYWGPQTQSGSKCQIIRFAQIDCRAGFRNGSDSSEANTKLWRVQELTIIPDVGWNVQNGRNLSWLAQNGQFLTASHCLTSQLVEKTAIYRSLLRQTLKMLLNVKIEGKEVELEIIAYSINFVIISFFLSVLKWHLPVW
ncbi:hypothetical protein MJT46_018379, partial [Ovis ammon polii x Ovis aries]